LDERLGVKNFLFVPVDCPVSVRRLGQLEFGAPDFSLMPSVFNSHGTVGCLAAESVFAADIADRLKRAGHRVAREVPVVVSHGSFSKTYFLDLVVDESVVYELKAVAQLTGDHQAQLLNYLPLLDVNHGKIINMRPRSVDHRFVNSNRTLADRRDFSVRASSRGGAAEVVSLVTDLLKDWGTGLSLALYYQAIVHYLGGESIVIRELPMQRDETSLGNQRFYMIDDTSAFRLSAFDQPSRGYLKQVQRLLTFSPLTAIHWINIAHQEITFTTVTKKNL
jgi:GxxExxY protein